MNCTFPGLKQESFKQIQHKKEQKSRPIYRTIDREFRADKREREKDFEINHNLLNLLCG